MQDGTYTGMRPAPKGLGWLTLVMGCCVLTGLRYGEYLPGHYLFGVSGWLSEMDVTLFFVAILIQWLLLRNPVLETALWLPVIFGGLGVLAAEVICRIGPRGAIAGWWLATLGMPLYAGAAVTVLAAKIKYLGGD